MRKLKNKGLASVILALSLIVILTGSISMAAPKATNTKTIKGTIENLNFKDKTITLLDYNGKRHTVRVVSTTIIDIEGVDNEMTNLYYGQELDISLQKNIAKKIVGYLEEDPELNGYIMPGTRFKSGSILFVSNKEIEINGKGGREKYRITPATRVIKNGGNIELRQAKVGDNVILNFDDIYSSEVSSLRIEDGERHISGILQGKVELIDTRNKELVLKSPSIYKEGQGWAPYSDHTIRLKTYGDQLYNGGEAISFKDLNLYRNQEVYIAFDESYGNMNIAKLQVKNGLSRKYESTVEDIEYNTGKMIVDKNLIHFNPGTIVIKDNRLVDVLNINPSKDVFVNTDVIRGMPTANFVSIGGSSILEDRIDDTKLLVYRGKIEDIYDYAVKIGKINYRLDHVKLMENNKWSQVKASERFDMSEDTLIYDSELKKQVPVDYFISSRYINFNDIKDKELRKRLEGNFYKNKTAYFVVRESAFGKELLALNLTPHVNDYRQDVNLDHSTIGEVGNIDLEKDTITFTKVKNFNTLNNRFENGKDQVVNVDRSTILLNDIPIPLDKLYLIEKGSKAYIIKNKQSSKDTGYIILLEN